ncbi:hypothetical protein GCM10010430_19120 [Kitasatospora cystarginea]|uniref:Uncharacterized protein n=1 Tax=Kitasatospora cystarginea TaxID=58350 RepID=A0ABN3DPH5_9ACTN
MTVLRLKVVRLAVPRLKVLTLAVPRLVPRPIREEARVRIRLLDGTERLRARQDCCGRELVGPPIADPVFHHASGCGVRRKFRCPVRARSSTLATNARCR